jgi:hypothetical protein
MMAMTPPSHGHREQPEPEADDRRQESRGAGDDDEPRKLQAGCARFQQLSAKAIDDLSSTANA